jgi:hypothetical protein
LRVTPNTTRGLFTAIRRTAGSTAGLGGTAFLCSTGNVTGICTRCRNSHCNLLKIKWIVSKIKRKKIVNNKHFVNSARQVKGDADVPVVTKPMIRKLDKK